MPVLLLGALRVVYQCGGLSVACMRHNAYCAGDDCAVCEAAFAAASIAERGEAPLLHNLIAFVHTG